MADNGSTNGKDDDCTVAAPAAVRSRPVSFCGFAKGAAANGGLLVESADPNSSAAKAGIRVGDEILALNDVKLTDAAQAMALLQSAGIGASVKVALVRQGEPLELTMTVQAKSLALDLDDLDEVVERKIAPAA